MRSTMASCLKCTASTGDVSWDDGDATTDAGLCGAKRKDSISNVVVMVASMVFG